MTLIKTRFLLTVNSRQMLRSLSVEREGGPVSEVQAPLAASLVREQVFERLRQQILSGALAPGERLNEVAIAGEYGISRGPVREASQRLVSEGLVRMIERRGAYVVTISADELRELYEVRRGLESLGSRLAAERADPKAARRLLDELAAVEQQLRQGEPGGYPLDRDFHRSVMALTQNARLEAAVAQQHQLIQLARAKSGADPQRAAEAYAEHMRIAEAVVAGDGTAAYEAMWLHLQNSLESARSRLCAGEGREGQEG
jgi:DNA-binding GntR family transcriptional regulator